MAADQIVVSVGPYRLVSLRPRSCKRARKLARQRLAPGQHGKAFEIRQMLAAVGHETSATASASPA